MYETWLKAEAFYTLTMPILVLVFLFLLIVYILAYSYTDPRKKARKIATRSFLILIICSGSYFVWGHAKYNAWVEANEYINPGIREHTYIMGMKSPEDPSMVRVYRRSNALYKNVSALEMYTGEKVQRDFVYPYLGSRGEVHYFAYGDEEQYAFTYRGDIEWTDDERVMNGWRFNLIDDQFEEIGFYNEFDIIFESIALKRDEQKELDAVNTAYVVTIEEMFAGWIFDMQF